MVYRAGMFAVLLGLIGSPARADLVLTFEDPGVQSTSVSGVTTETFDGLSSGYFGGPLTTAVGTISSSGRITAANRYGGAGGVGKYLSLGYASGSETSLLTLNGAQSYFGFWWSAADAGNQVQFLSGGSVIGSLDPATTLAALSSQYFGNPNDNFLGQDRGEKFVYVNAYGTKGTKIDQVRFSNVLRGTGFEMDNFSVRAAPLAVPEPSSLVMAATGGMIGLGRWLRTRKKS